MVTATTWLVALAAVHTAPGATLSGAVESSPEGEALDDVAVYVIDERFELYGDRADTGGAWAVTDLPAGAYRVWAVPGDEADQVSRVWPDSTDFCDAERIVLTGDEDRTGIDFSLPQGGAVTGWLVDPGGAPLGGVTVTAESDGTTSTAMDRQVETDADGWFEIVGLDASTSQPRPWRLLVEADDLPDQALVDGISTYESDEATWLEIGLGDLASVGEHEIQYGIVVTGRVEAPDGAAIGQGTVHVYSDSQIRSVSVEEDGSWLAVGLPPGRVLPWVSTTGFGLTYYPDNDRPTDWLDSPGEGGTLEDVLLSPPYEATLSVRLLADDGGAPVTADWDGASVLLYNDTYTVGRGDSVDAEGRLTLSGLHGGTYFLNVFAAEEGFLDDWVRGDDGERATIDIEAETAMPELDLPLERGARLSGVVLDDDGEPIYGATVMAVDASGETTRRDTTGRDGLYEIDGLRAGPWTIAAGYAPVCNVDGGYVTVYLPDTVDPARAEPQDLGAGEARGDVDFTLPRDGDLDQMSDAWEEEHGLDTTRDDSAEDPDGDGLTNLQEYRLGFDPHSADATIGEGCGCGERGADTALLLPLLPLVGLRRRHS